MIYFYTISCRRGTKSTKDFAMWPYSRFTFSIEMLTPMPQLAEPKAEKRCCTGLCLRVSTSRDFQVRY